MSDKQVSFKERVWKTVSLIAKSYQCYFVDYDYLLCSTAFVKHPYYIVSAEKNNFQHLTGVSFSESADEFFEKCIRDTLTESDIILSKNGRNSAEIKGSVRRKIQVLSDIIGILHYKVSYRRTFLEIDYSVLSQQQILYVQSVLP